MTCNVKHTTIIPLKLAYDESSIYWIKHFQSREVTGVSEKTDVEVIWLSEEDTGIYELLTFIGKFQ
jgi:hypothetical protein